MEIHYLDFAVHLGSRAVFARPQTLKKDMDSIEFLDKAEVLQAVEDVRSDKSPKDWLIISHKDGDHSSVMLHSSGEGGLSEFLENLVEDQVQYAFLAIKHKIDLSEVKRFVTIYFMPSSIGLADSARYGRAYSLIQDILGQTHSTIEVGSKQDISEEVIVSKISAAAGTNKNFYNSNEALNTDKLSSYRYTPMISPSSAKTSSPAGDIYSFIPGKSANNIIITAEDELLSVIGEVRNGNESNTWVVCSYRDDSTDKTLYMVATGSGNLNSMKTHLHGNSISYAFTRIDTVLDGNKYPKYVFIRWIGSSVSAIKKAKACVQGSSVAEIFGDTHVDISASDLSEIDESAIMQKVASWST